MASLAELGGNISVFFILNVPDLALRNIFKSEKFTEIPGAPRLSMIAPGIELGPPTLPLAMFKKTKIDYVGVRYILRLTGPLSELKELTEVVPEAFENEKYSLKKITRYCEFHLPIASFEIQGAVDTIRSKIAMQDIERLSEACGYDMKPFRISLSNLDTPLHDEWLQIMLTPDINSPHDRLLIEIIKRTRTFHEMHTFIGKIEDILNGVLTVFGAT